ncbi:MAG TPA: DUF4326 domain-containing protein [Actinomycetota bacterium]
MPSRVQLRRTRGWRLPPGAVSVAAPTKWQNPFRPRARSPEANARAVERYRGHLAEHPELVEAARQELVGKDLACWCAAGLPCHADVLLEIANQGP